MNELSAALRQFADQIDAGQILPGAIHCAIVVGNTKEVKAAYIGPYAPASKAGIQLLAEGVVNFNSHEVVTQAPGAGAAAAGAQGDSIFEADR